MSDDVPERKALEHSIRDARCSKINWPTDRRYNLGRIGKDHDTEMNHQNEYRRLYGKHTYFASSPFRFFVAVLCYQSHTLCQINWPTFDPWSSIWCCNITWPPAFVHWIITLQASHKVWRRSDPFLPIYSWYFLPHRETTQVHKTNTNNDTDVYMTEFSKILSIAY